MCALFSDSLLRSTQGAWVRALCMEFEIVLEIILTNFFLFLLAGT